MKTATIFRKYRTGEIIALFPEEPGDMSIKDTRPATPEESAPLAAELARIGYDILPMQKLTRLMCDRRQQALRRPTA